MKKLILILLCLPIIGFGQQWTKEYYFAGAPGADWDDDRFSVQQTSDNGFMIFSGHLIKTDIYGDTIWTKDIGRVGGDGIQTSDGGYLAVSGDSLSRLDSSGNFIWQKDVYFSPYRGIQTLDNGFAFIDNVSGNTKDGPHYPYLVKTNFLGDTLWTKRYTEGYSFKSVYQTQDSSFFITGSDSSLNVLLMKVNSTGSVLWNYSFGLFTEGGRGEYITQTNDGGFIITGEVEEFGCDKLLLLKTNSLGVLLWAKTISSSFCDDIGYFVQQTTDGGYIITGDFWTGSSQTKMWLIKTDMNGDTLWTRKFGTPYGNGQSVRQTNDGGYVITGNFYQNVFSVAVVLIKTNSLGVVTEITDFTPPTNSKILKLTDLLGRETKGTNNEVLFYIYDDGTVEKRIVIE